MPHGKKENFKDEINTLTDKSIDFFINLYPFEDVIEDKIKNICQMKKTTFFLILLFIPVLMLTFSGCRKHDDCIIGNGILETEERREDEFNAVSVWGGYYQVFVHIGEPWNNIILEGESNILPMINTISSLKRLEILTLEDVCIQPTLPVKLDVYTPQLTSIGLSGKSLITTDSIISEHFRIYMRGGGLIKANITTDSLKVDAYWNGRIELEGKATKGYLNINDDVLIKSYPLIQDSCFVSLIGSGIIYVYVENYLNVKIIGDGTVYYTGNPPTVETEIIGSGRVVHE